MHKSETWKKKGKESTLKKKPLLKKSVTEKGGAGKKWWCDLGRNGGRCEGCYHIHQ